MIPIRSFTTTYNGLYNRLLNDVGIGLPFNPNISSSNKQKDQIAGTYRALWDTGATSSFITEQVVKDIGLNPIGMARINHAGGSQDCPTYLVSLWLPNRVCLPSIRVTQGNLKDVGLLIGMDIINQGDFAVNNKDGVTSFSFRIPSLEKIDFAQVDKNEPETQRTTLKQPCPCGSGKPFEDCHGKKTKRGRRKSSRSNE